MVTQKSTLPKPSGTLSEFGLNIAVKPAVEVELTPTSSGVVLKPNAEIDVLRSFLPAPATA